jgi:hypothetical protein
LWNGFNLVVAILKEERYVPIEARAPPRPATPQTRIALTKLWARLPEVNQRQALVVLGRIVAQHLHPATLDVEKARDRDGDQDVLAPLRREAGDEDC